MASRDFYIIDDHIGGAARRPVLRLGGRALVRRLRAMLRLWAERARDRRQLARLDERLLADIGLTRDDADRICATPFWRASDEGDGK